MNLDQEVELLKGRIYDPTFKGALHLHSQALYYRVYISRGLLLQRLMKERVDLDMSGMIFPPNHRFYKTFDRKIQRLFEAGFIDYFRTVERKCLNSKRYEHLYRDQPQVLTLKHLEAGFVVCSAAMSISILVFVFEWLTKFKDYWRKTK